jgi:hypothetical protein
LGAAARHQVLADFYAFGFNHPDRYWDVVSSEERTDALLHQVTSGALRPPANWAALSAGRMTA